MLDNSGSYLNDKGLAFELIDITKNLTDQFDLFLQLLVFHADQTNPKRVIWQQEAFWELLICEKQTAEAFALSVLFKPWRLDVVPFSSDTILYLV